MKTTVEISDELLKKALRLATKRRTTLSGIVEQGLRKLLNEEQCGAAYVLPDKSIDGNGLQPEFRNKPWSDIRDAANDGRGG